MQKHLNLTLLLINSIFSCYSQALLRPYLNALIGYSHQRYSMLPHYANRKANEFDYGAYAGVQFRASKSLK
ncbi:hypothetical protein SAMN06265379_10149 [Saccharicrinis carchari]|uniref:Uncharacterized protein n=1 Tax=Saccharicrinis carchari TaxID=1168039 RepID=A0A521AD48_SACCC|nr:hypothetical protein [Saccharicrinis carchari]SMO32754.1 hypothetical protein SAMN06265379_10149 [Saccharicrinis carchari]